MDYTERRLLRFHDAICSNQADGGDELDAYGMQFQGTISQANIGTGGGGGAVLSPVSTLAQLQATQYQGGPLRLNPAGQAGPISGVAVATGIGYDPTTGQPTVAQPNVAQLTLPASTFSLATLTPGAATTTALASQCKGTPPNWLAWLTIGLTLYALLKGKL
jgi:hypothetical protein